MQKQKLIKCQEKGCDSIDLIECFLPDYADEPSFWYCPEHAEKNGFCCCCGDFWGGIESFDFIHPGLCDNCYDQLQADCGECEEEDRFDYDWEDE